MSFRAKCPACGRKQSVPEGEESQTVFCSACGTRFSARNIQSKTPETVEPTSQADQPTEDISIVPTYEPPVPPPIVSAPPVLVKWLFPVSASLVLLTGVAIVVGIYSFSGWLHNYPNQSNSKSTPASTQAIRPATQTTSQPVEVSSSKKLETPEAAPHDTGTVVNEPNVVSSAVRATSQSSTAPDGPVKFRPVDAQSNEAADLDGKIGGSIKQGVDFLMSQFTKGQLTIYKKEDDVTAGADALAVYALLHAAEATHDLRLLPNSPLVDEMLEALKKMPMDGSVATYCRSLRAAALGVYHRPQDIAALRADAFWLMRDSVNGAFGYSPPANNSPATPLRQFFNRQILNDSWDNSNSQYGALGVWAAMDAGIEIENAFWVSVQKHWLSCQLPDGEWSYHGYGDYGRLSMTVAGITTLLVAEDQLNAKSVVSTLGHPPFTPALAHALTWLEAGNNAVNLPSYYSAYNLFGLERAALASGFKYFGTHDWYRELVPLQLKNQRANGSWLDDQGSEIVDTAYTLLFLSRGRHPIFMNKLRFDGFWSNRPRDISNLTHFAGSVLERPLNWQVVTLKSNWTDWMDSPVLYIASHEALKFSDDDCDKLRSFAENGGLIFTHADGDSGLFNKSVAQLSHRLFPQYTLADLPATHPIYSTVFRVKQTIRLQGVSNGSRLLLVNSPTDLDKAWQVRDSVGRPGPFEMGVNIFIYAAGKSDLRNKLKTPVVADPQIEPIRTTTVAELRYPGDWNPEPAGLPRFARMFFTKTSVKVNVLEADASQLDAATIPLAHLTGTGSFRFTPAELQAIHNYVANGGILIVDACGASPNFNKSIQLDFLPHGFSKSMLGDMRESDPILAGTGEGMAPITLRLRPYRKEIDGGSEQPIEYFNEGKGMVIFTPIDLSSALLGTNTWAINGYQPETAYELFQNALLFALEK